MRKIVWLVMLGVFALQAQAAVMETITQTTTGWCSPAVGLTGGNVTINCQGVDPKALVRLNELLDKKDLELQAKIRDAEEWTQKYRDLHQRLTEEGRDDALAQQAKKLLEEGKLEEAGAIIDRLLMSGERLVEQVAADHFKRAEVYALQFQPPKALPHYEKAYRYRPDNNEYALQYAYVLQQQNSYAQAQPVYQSVLRTYRQLAETNPAAYLPAVARTLNNLGILYRDTQRLQESEQVYLEALRTYRQLAETNPAAYLPYVAHTLNNLGILYRNTQRLQESEQAFQEALRIRRQLAETNPAAYLPYVAHTLNNLGILYRNTQRLQESEQAFQEALRIRRQLAETNPAAYLPAVALTLNNLGNLYGDTQRLQESEQAFQEALRIRRQLAETNPAAYLPAVAWTLTDLALLLLEGHQPTTARLLVEEALTIRRRLWEKYPTVYGNVFAQSLRVSVQILLQMAEERPHACKRLHDIVTVATSESLIRWAHERTEEVCGTKR